MAIGVAWVVCGLSGGAHAGHLYIADGALSNAGNLYRVDTSTALATPIGALVDGSGAAYSVNGMAWDSATNTLFGSTSAASPTLPNGFVRINPSNGQVTPVGSLGLTPPNFAADLTFQGGTLYGWAEGSLSALITINTLTGSAAVVGPNGQNINTTGSGLAANAAGTVFSTSNLATGSIWQVNTATGQLFGPTGLSGGTANGRIGALEFESGILYGTELVGDGISGITSNRLISIDPITGAITNIGQYRDANTLAFLRNIDAMAVPSPGGVAALLGFVVFAQRRRR
jgi:hypothetical protein